MLVLSSEAVDSKGHGAAWVKARFPKVSNFQLGAMRGYWFSVPRSLHDIVLCNTVTVIQITEVIRPLDQFRVEWYFHLSTCPSFHSSMLPLYSPQYLTYPFQIWPIHFHCTFFVSNFRAIRQFQIQISRLQDFVRSYNKTFYQTLKQGLVDGNPSGLTVRRPLNVP